MSIDAISSSKTSAIVSAIDSSTQDLLDRRRREAAQFAADAPQAAPEGAATVVTISDEVLAARRIADDLALRDAADAARKLAASDAVQRDTVNRAAGAETSAVQEAIDALREASQENFDLNGEAIGAERDRATDASAADQDAVAFGATEQQALQVGTTNAGIQVSYGALASTLTGDAPLRQPGLSIFA